MSRAQRRISAAVSSGFFAVAVTLLADVQGTKRDAEALLEKVAAITAFGERPSKQARRTPVTEKEVNAYLVYEAAPYLPTGVVTPTVTILGTGRVSARAIVDLDAVRKQKNPTSLFDPSFYLTGRLPVTAVGVLTTSKGIGRLQLESATLGGIPIPKTVLQEIVSHYSRSPEKPQGIGLDDPFPLPANIREIQVGLGQAIIVQ
jgi:hypothetical protein